MQFNEIPKSMWPLQKTEKPRIKVYVSDQFLVQLFDEGSEILRITVNRTSRDGRGNWVDGISWDELQEIKNTIGYKDKFAVEVYPAENDIVNVANMRHLWVLPKPLGFEWRKD